MPNPNSLTNHVSTADASDYSAFDSDGLIVKNKDLDNIFNNFDDILTELKGIKNVDAGNIVGNSTLTDGGTVGKYLDLFMCYIEDFRKKGALDKKEVGDMFGRAMELAASNALQIEMSSSQIAVSKAKAMSDLSLTIANTNEASTRESLTRVEVAKGIYEHERIQPLQRILLEEDVVIKHLQHEIAEVDKATSEYKLDVMLPKESILLDKQSNKIGKDIDLISSQISVDDVKKDLDRYNLNNVLPKESTLLTHQATKFLKDIDMVGTQIDVAEVKKDLDVYKLDNILPKEAVLLTKNALMIDEQITKSQKESSLITEQVRVTGIQADTGLYTLSTIMPLEKEKLIKDTHKVSMESDLISKNISIAEVRKLIDLYTLNNILPRQASKLDKEAEVADKQSAKAVAEISLINADRLIKEYYKANVQPREAQITEAKAIQERMNAGLVGGATPLPIARISQLEKQTELYDRQEEAYDDNKYQKLLDTQVNYAAMVFADDPEPTVLNLGKNLQVDHTYSVLKP